MESHSPMNKISTIQSSSLLIEYLGQAGFWMRAPGVSFLIDPYLSNYVLDSRAGSGEGFQRAFPPPEAPQTMPGVDLVFITHDHADHCDPQTLMPLYQANPHLKIVCPPSCSKLLRSHGIPDSNLLEPATGEPYHMGDLTFTVVPSAHYSREIDPATGKDLYVGYVINVNGVSLYHSGDTILYPGMLESIQSAAPDLDVVCLPVNGRDATREQLGIVGNLNGQEALQITRQLSARVLLPMHNDLFASNHEDPGVLASLANREAPLQRIHWLKPGEVYWYLK
jgi:L-ascorbate metabolism protein UlaG (beta-lactamase superfamily)